MSLRILQSSNGPFCGTGYGTQTKMMGHMFQSLGHHVDYFAWYGLQGGMLHMGDSVIYPRLQDPYGGDAQTIISHSKADVLITLQDVWVLPKEFGRSLSVPWVAYTPIDCDPLPYPIRDRLEHCPYPLAFTDFGRQVMQEGGISHAAAIPHAIDTAVFKPGSKAEARRVMGIDEDTYLVSMVAANASWPSRKSYPEAIAAFAEFRRDRPDAVLYLHTAVNPPESLDLKELVRLCGLDKTAVKTVDQADYMLGLPDEYVATVYQASDVLLAPSQGEGFGLPIAEAQACGCPVITTNFSATAEILANGYLVEPLTRFYVPTGSYQVIVGVEAITAGLRNIAAWTDEHKQAAARRGVQAMQERYSVEAVTPLWGSYLECIEERLNG